MLLQGAQRLGSTPVDADVRQRAAPVGGVIPTQGQGAVVAGFAEEIFALQEDVFGRQQRPLFVVLQKPVALARVDPKAAQGVVHFAVQDQCCASAEVVKNGGGFFKKQRQVVLDATAGQARGHVFVDAAFGRIALDALAPACAKSRARGLVHGEFAPRQQAHFGHGIKAALAVGVEGANGVHFIAEQVHAVRHRRAHGEEVDEATAHGVFTRRHDLAHVLIACQCQLRLEPGFVEPHLLFEVEGVAGHEGRWRQSREGRGGGQKHDIHLAVFDAPQRGKSL